MKGLDPFFWLFFAKIVFSCDKTSHMTKIFHEKWVVQNVKMFLVLWATTFILTTLGGKNGNRIKNIDLWFLLLRKIRLMSKIELFDQLFQITGTDTQRKSCSSWKMLYENVVDHVSIMWLWGATNRTKRSKIFKKLSSLRGHRNFFLG